MDLVLNNRDLQLDDLEEIATIKVEHKNTEESFIINQVLRKVNLQNIDGKVLSDFNNALTENYVLQYEKFFYNRIAEANKQEADSILNKTPDYKVTVTTNGGDVKQVNFVLKKLKKPIYNDVTGKYKEIDDNHIFGYIVGEEELYLFQYFALGNMLTTKDYFLQK